MLQIYIEIFLNLSETVCPNFGLFCNNWAVNCVCLTNCIELNVWATCGGYALLCAIFIKTTLWDGSVAYLGYLNT